MKKTIKTSVLFIFMAIMLVALTGCGGNKLVATKSTSADDSLAGACEEKIEITFKNDKADKIVWTMEFEDENNASTIVGLYKLASSELSGMDIKQDGKKVVLTMDAKAFAETSDIKEDELSKDSIKKSLEDAGYTVK
ncbi:MAG: hypothetical protein IKD76_04735 [Clostridia bacterium]|nr:hypothetical protein [Clostridia bacterium]